MQVKRLVSNITRQLLRLRLVYGANTEYPLRYATGNSLGERSMRLMKAARDISITLNQCVLLENAPVALDCEVGY